MKLSSEQTKSPPAGADGDSEFALDSGILQNAVRGVARPDVGIDGNRTARNRIVPDLVVAFPGTLEAPPVIAEKLADLPRVIGHQAAMRTR